MSIPFVEAFRFEEMKEGGEASLGVFPGRCVRSDFAGRGVEIDRGDLVVGDRVWDVGRNVVNEVAEVSVSTLTDDPGGPVELVKITFTQPIANGLGSERKGGGTEVRLVRN